MNFRLVAPAVLGLAFVACGGSSENGAVSAAEANHPLIGKVAPPFAKEAAVGSSTYDLAQSRGKVVVVAFWATWCEPCKKAFPKLQEIYAKYQASGVDVVGISEDDERDGIAEFAGTYGAKFPVVWDSGKKIAGKWEPKSMPATFILDKTGTVRFAHLGYHDGEDVEIAKEVKSLL